MNNKKDSIQKGSHVWYFDYYDNLQSNTVTDIQTLEGQTYAIFNGTGCKLEDAYLSKQACLDAKQRSDEAEIEAIKAKIQTVEDLVRYMYNNVVSCAEEYTNWNARKAVAIRAKELLNIDL